MKYTNYDELIEAVNQLIKDTTDKNTIILLVHLERDIQDAQNDDDLDLEYWNNQLEKYA